MLSPYFCQTRSCSSDYSKRSWKQTPRYTASLWKNDSSFLSLLSHEKGIPDKPPAEGRWRRLSALERPSPPRHFHSPSPAAAPRAQPGVREGAADLALRSQPSPSFLFCGGFPTIEVNSSIIHPLKRALPFFACKNVKGDRHVDFLSRLPVTNARTSRCFQYLLSFGPTARWNYLAVSD